MKTLPLLITAAALSFCGPLSRSQTLQERPVPGGTVYGRHVPPPVRTKPYFSDPADPDRQHGVGFRTVEQMSEPDRLIAANAESSIGEHVKYTGLEFNEGAWTYEQVVCPALPNHLFLRFLRNNGTGDVSMFTASIPREGEGRVRIIPIQLRGYSLFSPAPINAITISTFNHIRDEENPGQAPDWLGVALCYASLAGGHPQAAQVNDHPEREKYPLPGAALLEVGSEGGAELTFIDVSSPARPMKWTMTFDAKGRLVKGGHFPAQLLQVSMVHPLSVSKVGPPMPMTKPKVKTMHPPAPGVVMGDPSAPPQTSAPMPAGNPPS
jgi:hypothetical protein